MIKDIIKLGIACALLMTVSAAAADSLYPEEAKYSLYDYVRAKEVGDVVTIHIIEQASAKQESSTQMEKDANVSAGLGTGYYSGSASLPVQQWGVGSNKYHKGTGTARRSGEFVATVTAKVVGKLPNGHLLVKGERSIQIDDELQTIEVSGEIRPQDIRRDNSVLSSDIAAADIKYKGHGAMAENSKPGLIVRILSWLWIF